MKNIIKGILGNFFKLKFSYKFMKSESLTVFCFHDVSNNPSEFSYKHDLNVPPDIFDYQIDFIDRNFNVISPDELLAFRIPSNAALITFDDGFKSYFTNAISILKKYNLPSIIFLNMEPIKGAVFWSGLITYLCDKHSEFRRHIASKAKLNYDEKSLYLYCSREIVNSFLKLKGDTFKSEVEEYIGDFATLQDLESVSSNKLVFFGNHLYNHDVPLLLSDNELIESFCKNEDELRKYPNSRNMFAFPFGQPDTCFSGRQIELLLENGAKKVFSAYPVINSDISAPYLHRIPLDIRNNTKSRIWFNILRRSFKI